MKFDGYLLVSDMDATLLTSKHAVSDKNREAIEYFISNGGKFTVASGRMKKAVRSFFGQLKINAPAILHNGAQIYDFHNEKILYERFIEEERKEAIRRVYNEVPGFGLEVYCDDTVYVYRECLETRRFNNRKYEVVYELPYEIWERPWVKFLIIGEKKELDRFEPIYKRDFDSGYSVRSGKKYLDIVSSEASKGNALQKIIEILGVDRQKVIAVGDNMNDISMLEAAGISCAVENAEKSVKEKVDFIVPDNNSDAIAYIIEMLEGMCQDA